MEAQGLCPRDLIEVSTGFTKDATTDLGPYLCCCATHVYRRQAVGWSDPVKSHCFWLSRFQFWLCLDYCGMFQAALCEYMSVEGWRGSKRVV